MKYFKLNDGLEIPAIGFGTFKIEDQKEMDKAIQTAFENGYRYIDTAKLYKNEAILGNTLRNAPLKREEYRLATKVWPDMFGKDLTRRSIDKSLDDLQVDYIDVIHLHWFGKYFEQAWKSFEDYKRQGIVKSIAVCNFTKEHIEKLLEQGQAPSMDQLESSPHLQDDKLVDFLKDKNIIHQAWSPLARGRSGLLEEEVLLELSKKYNKTPAQIALRWNVDRGTMVIPKSSNPERIKENISIFDFEIDKKDLEKIRTIDKNKRYSHDPEDEKWLNEIGRY